MHCNCTTWNNLDECKVEEQHVRDLMLAESGLATYKIFTPAGFLNSHSFQKPLWRPTLPKADAIGLSQNEIRSSLKGNPSGPCVIN